MPGLQITNSNSFISNEGMGPFNDDSVKELEKIVLPKFYNEQGVYLYEFNNSAY